MVSAVNRTISTSDHMGVYRLNTENQQTNTTSIDSYYKDPDLLIRSYFLSTPNKRTKLRKAVVRSFPSWRAVLEVLKWSINGKASDAHDGAVDLLAEIDNINFLIDTSKYLETSNELWSNTSNVNQLLKLDSCWEILIKAIACAYKIPAEARFELTLKLSLIRAINTRRILKSTLIDALLLLADEIDTEHIKNAIARFASGYETDQYIRNYAEEAIQELS
ncbi:hypothetical protein [Aulosira sp. FACHB-615]|uniref:hypothetical protein n=1 Tax=Aulosira sp. FACHB-615 TaxID=2692777 RepID=UPI001685D35A|nr:hypothetical protein [Aulosira sp. FACHB-615]MBD2492431.1 hypothetical protein [Aulosira sp. FACHB-615]